METVDPAFVHWVPQRWQLNGSDINLSVERHYKQNRGDLVVVNPDRNQDAGSYQCFATNSLGTIISREAKLQFAYLENFKTKMRSTVSVREGQGVVLLCGPPPHSGVFTASSPRVDSSSRDHRLCSSARGISSSIEVLPSDCSSLVTSSVSDSGSLMTSTSACGGVLHRPVNPQGHL